MPCLLYHVKPPEKKQARNSAESPSLKSERRRGSGISISPAVCKLLRVGSKSRARSRSSLEYLTVTCTCADSHNQILRCPICSTPSLLGPIRLRFALHPCGVSIAEVSNGFALKGSPRCFSCRHDSLYKSLPLQESTQKRELSAPPGARARSRRPWPWGRPRSPRSPGLAEAVRRRARRSETCPPRAARFSLSKPRCPGEGRSPRRRKRR